MDDYDVIVPRRLSVGRGERLFERLRQRMSPAAQARAQAKAETMLLADASQSHWLWHRLCIVQEPCYAKVAGYAIAVPAPRGRPTLLAGG